MQCAAFPTATSQDLAQRLEAWEQAVPERAEGTWLPCSPKGPRALLKGSELMLVKPGVLPNVRKPSPPRPPPFVLIGHAASFTPY